MDRCVGLAGYPPAFGMSEQELYDQDTRQLWALGITVGAVIALGAVALVWVVRNEMQRS